MSAEDPFTQTQYYNDAEVLHDPNVRICFVYISNFFDDQTNLFYYIRGTHNLKMFLGGMYGMQAFDGPLLFAVSPYDSSYALKYTKGISLPRGRKDRVVKSNAQLPLNKWRYIYETGRLAWEKSEVDLEKTRELMEMRCNVNDISTNLLTDDDTDIDPEDNADSSDTYPTESNNVLQSIKSAISAENQARMKILEQGASLSSEQDEKEVGSLSNSGTFNMNVGCSIKNPNPKPSRETEGISGVQKTDLWMEGDHANLETYKKARQLDSVNEIWASLKDGVRHDKLNGIKRDAFREDLANQVVFLARREINLAQKKALISNISGSLKLAVELAELERDIAIDRICLVQCFANASAHRWKEAYKKVITGGIRLLQDIQPSKQHIRKQFIGILLYEGQEGPLETTNKLKIRDIEALLKLIDNIELQKEYLEKVETLHSSEANLKEFASLVDLGNTIHVDNEKQIAKLAIALFKNRADNPIRSTLYTADQEEIVGESLSAYREDLVARIMESTDQKENVAADLLQKSLWSADAAVAWWWYGGPLKLENNQETPTSDSSGSNPLHSSLKNTAKRSYIAEAGPSRPKKQRTGKEQERARSPEDLDTARARLERIIARENVAQLEQEKQPHQKKSWNPQERPVGSKPIVQEGLSVLPRDYSLELLNKMIADEAQVQAEGLQDKKATESNTGPNPDALKSPIVPETSTTFSLSGKRYNVSDRSQRDDYSDLNSKLNSVPQDNMPTRGQIIGIKYTMDGLKDKKEYLTKLQSGQSSSSSASSPPSRDLLRPVTTASSASASPAGKLLQTVATVMPEDTSLIIANVQGRTLSREELKTLVRGLPVPYIYGALPTGLPTIFTSTADTEVSHEQNLYTGGEEQTPGQRRRIRSDELPGRSEEYQTSMRKRHSFMERTIKYLANRYVAMHKQTFKQPFVPASSPAKSGTELLGPGEGMDKALKFIRSGVLTLAPQSVPSIDRLTNTKPNASPYDPLPQRTSPIISQVAPDRLRLPPLALPPSLPSIPLQPLEHEFNPLEQNFRIPDQTADPLSTSSGDLTFRDPFLVKHGFTNSSILPLNEPMTELPNTTKIDNWRKDSAQRMSVESAAALARTLVDTDAAAHATNHSQQSAKELGARKVKFSDEYKIVFMDAHASNGEKNRVHGVVNEGSSEAECPKEWNEDTR